MSRSRDGQGRIQLNEFEKLFLECAPLIDVRAPIEFGEGSIPGAINRPLLEDDERHEIGITYKNRGQEAAIELGHKLVSGEVRVRRENLWIESIKAQPNSFIYCFRGGLRSQITQSWLKERGVDCPIIEGGYKALRTYLLENLARQIERLEFQVVTGPTGSGKTTYLHNSKTPFVDLEALARHRGSAFGAMPEPQPRQIDFENWLSVDLLHASRTKRPILIEDESEMIGKLLVPKALFVKMQSSPRLVLDVPIETRVENILQDYVIQSSLGERRDLTRFDEFRSSVRAIARRLGGTRTQEILIDIGAAQRDFENGRGFEANRVWIQKLLEWYYDPYYQHAFDRRTRASAN